MAVLFKGSSIFSKFSLPFSAATKAPEAAKAHPFQAFYREVAAADADRSLKLLRADRQGLSSTEAKRRLAKTGPNELAHEQAMAWPRQLWETLRSPFVLLLAALAVVNFYTDNETGGFIVSGMVAVSVTLTFFQEFRSNRAAERLQAMVTTTVSVLRREEMLFSFYERKELIVRQEKKEIPLKFLVPGDLLQLSAGDLIPADLRVLSAKDLFISQSALTGESFPVEKMAGPASAGATDSVMELANLCFMGSNVLSGTAQAVVVKTGQDTYFGSLAKSLATKRELSAFESGLNRFTLLMMRFMLVMVPAVFLINGFSKGDWFQAFLFAVAVAVGLTPEMLPMIVTVNLAKGALAMSRKKVLVKRLNSIQNFGAMDVLCTDKTGTLTADKVVLLKYVDPNGLKSPRVLRFAYLNSFHQTGLKNLLDIAVLSHKEMGQELKPDIEYRKVDEIPFDFQRRRMSVIVEQTGGPETLITKGALEEIFSVCDRVEVDGQVVPLDDDFRSAFRRVALDLGDDGLRLIAVAFKEMPAGHPAFSVQDESGMVLLGYLAFLDPPKESTTLAIAQLREHGIDIKVLTGDNDRVTRHICNEVGIPVDRMLLGGDIEAMSEADLEAQVEEVSVFAKLSPAQKERIVRALSRRGHVVGFMGDGINDAPALKAADVGISVDNAVDIAKESADIILMEKSLLVLEEGVLEGRKVFGNIIKYIKMGASSNFGNVFSVLIASVALPFLPMLSTQMLAQNLLYDFSQTAIPLDDVDPEYLAKPRRWEIGEIARFMVTLGPLSSLFDVATFLLLWFVFKANSPAQQSLFQSGWFVEGLISQTLIVHMIRTAKVPFFQSRASWPLLLTTGVIIAAGVAIPFTRLGAILGFQPLPGAFFGYLVLFLLAYCSLTQVVKTWFIRKYGFN